MSLLNVITELKKCCNHPFLFESAEEEYRGNEADHRSAADRLVATSGKMVLLDKLLVKLKATNHRVLIFSQVRHRQGTKQEADMRRENLCKIRADAVTAPPIWTSDLDVHRFTSI